MNREAKRLASPPLNSIKNKKEERIKNNMKKKWISVNKLRPFELINIGVIVGLLVIALFIILKIALIPN